jgi:hypothetical protein
MDSSYDDRRQEASGAKSPQNKMGKKLIDRVRDKLRAGHDSIRTEGVDLHRLERFLGFFPARAVASLGGAWRLSAAGRRGPSRHTL